MALSFSEIVEEARLSARALLDYGDHFFKSTVRLGVTGLSRAGKTVFITALIHASRVRPLSHLRAFRHGADRSRPACAAARRCGAAFRL